MRLYLITTISFLCLSAGLLSVFAKSVQSTVVRDSNNDSIVATEYNPPGTGSPYSGRTRFHEQPTSSVDV